MVNFCQHSEYSFLGSLLKVKDLVHFNAFQGYSACSLTDTLSTFGYYSLTRMCLRKNIKPVYGITLFTNGVSGKGCYPIVLIAHNNIGLSNIFKLNSLSHQRFEKELNYRLTLKELAEHKEGITFIAEAEILSHYDNYTYLTQYFEKMKDLFFNQYYVSINYTGHPKVDLIKQVLALIRHYDVPGLANIESRYHHPDKEAFFYLNAFRQKHHKEDERGYPLDPEMDYSVRSSQEFDHLFSNHPDLLENNNRLLSSIEAHIDLEHTTLSSSEQSADRLERMCELSLMQLGKNTEVYQDRLNREMDKIRNNGLSDTYLFLQSLLENILREHIPQSPGTGLSIASLVFYLFRQHHIDPLEHPLLSFTRLTDHPHFEIDVGWKDKQKVIDFVIKHFGSAQIAHAAAITHLLGRSTIRDISQVYPLSKDEVNKILEFFPSFQSGSEKYIRPHLQKSLSLQNYVRNNPEALQFLEICSRIEGIPLYAGPQNDTIIVVPQGVDKYFSLEYYQDSRYMCQISKEDILQSNILSLDIRGQRMTNVLFQLTRIVPLDAISLDDTKVWMAISTWSQHSISILENQYLKTLCRQLKPDSIDTLTELFALQYNYSLKNSQKAESFISRKSSRESYEIPGFLKDILAQTYGILLYEEQLNQIFSHIKCYTDASVKNFYHALKNRDDESIPPIRQDLLEACRLEKMDDDFAVRLVNMIMEEAATLYPYYQALSNAYFSYYAVYFWTYYKKEYYLHYLNNAIGYPVKINDLIAEARSQGIKILGLDINHSNVYFTPEKEDIRTGLIVIKYLNSNDAQTIVNIRRDRPYISLVDFLIRHQSTNLSKRQVENIIKSGALRWDHPDIGTLLEAYPIISQWIRDNHIQDHSELDEFGLFQNNPEKELPVTMDFCRQKTLPPQSELADMEYIQESTDLFLDQHPVHKYQEDLNKMDIDKLSHLPQLNYAVCAVYLYKLRVIQTKNEKEMAFASISDPSGLSEAVFFPAQYKRFIHVIKEKELFLIKGKTDENKILVDEIYKLDAVL